MNPPTEKTKKGLLFALLASVVSGLAIAYSKISVAKIDPLLLTTSRNLYVAVLFFVFLLGTNKVNKIRQLTRRNIMLLIIIGIIGGSVPFYLFFTGLQSVNAVTANFVHKTIFLWSTILAVVILHERFNPAYLLSYLLVIIGSLCLGPANFQLNQGALLVVAATLLWSVENILAKKVLRRVASETVGLFRMGIGSVLLLGALLATRGVGAFLIFDVEKATTVVIGGTLLFGYVYLWYKALAAAPVGLVTLLLTFSVVVGNLLGGAFTGLRFSGTDIYSSVLITAGTLVAFLLSSLLARKSAS